MARSSATCCPRRPPGRPDLVPVASLLLCVFTVFSASTFSLSPVEPPVQLPYLNRGQPCLPDKGAVAISVDAAGRFYFSNDTRAVQTATIRQLAARYGVRFTRHQLTELEQLPYLGMDVRQLPAYLVLPLPERRLQRLTGLPHSYHNDQLTACLLLARRTHIEQLSSAPYVVLRADAQTTAADVKQFMHVLQRHHLNRFYASFQ